MAMSLTQIHEVANDPALLKWIAGGLVTVAKAKADAQLAAQEPDAAELALCYQILGASDLLPIARGCARALLGEFYDTGNVAIVDGNLQFGENVDDDTIIDVLGDLWPLLLAGS